MATKRVKVIGLIGVGLLVSGVLALVVVNRVTTQDNKRHYEAGQRAYLVGDCITALDEFGKIQGQQGGYGDRATDQISECTPIAAVQSQESTQPAVALVGYMEFAAANPNSPLITSIGSRVAALVQANSLETLATTASCAAVTDLESTALTTAASLDLEAFNVSCIGAYDRAGEADQAYSLAKEVLAQDRPGDDTALAYLAASSLTCTELDVVATLPGVAAGPDTLAGLLLGCVSSAADREDGAGAAQARAAFVARFPDRPEAATLQADLLGDLAACAYADVVLTDVVRTTRPEFAANFLFGCGQLSEAAGNPAGAAAFFDRFLSQFPDEARAAEANSALARTLIASAKSQGAGELPPPSATGRAKRGTVDVIVQNASPDTLRIAVNGPQARVESLPPCTECTTYAVAGPVNCPENLPSLTLQLTPGTYDVLVESTDGSAVTPFVGSWDLVSGTRYESCFFIVTR